MGIFYSPSAGCAFLPSDKNRPLDCVEISAADYALILNPPPGKVRSHDAAGKPILIDQPALMPTTVELCGRIDAAADRARYSVVGDPLRAVEYERAASEAQAYAAAGYQGAVPVMVAAWAIGDRTPEQAVADILRESALYNLALEQLRTIRLSAKEQVRALMAVAELEQAGVVVDQAISAIDALVAGIGNQAE